MALLLLIIGVSCNLFLGALVVLKHKDRAARTLVFVALGLIEWEIANHMADRGGSDVLLWNRLTFLGPLIIILASLFFLVYLKQQRLRRPYVFMLLLGTLAISLLVMSSHVVAGVSPRTADGVIIGYDPVYGSGYAIYVCWMLFVVVLEMKRLFAPMKNETPQYVAQMHIIRIGTMLAIIIPVITNLILPNILNSSSSSQLVPLTSIVYMGSLSFAILKHKLLDIRNFALRAGAYSLTTVVLAGLYVAPTMFVLMKIMGFPFKPIQFTISTIIGTLVATNYYRLNRWFNGATSKIFFRDSYEPAMLMAELNRSLVSIIDVKRMLSVTVGVVEAYLKPELCYLVIKPHGSKNIRYRSVGTSQESVSNDAIVHIALELDRLMEKDVALVESLAPNTDMRKMFVEHDIAAVSRLVTNGSTRDAMGYLIVGVRKSGKPYDTSDVQVIEAVSNTLVIAVQNALHFEEIQQFNATLQDKVEEQTRKYRMANEKLKKLDETKDEFISMASHQLRTPLTSVKGYLSMVLEGDAGKLNKQQEELLKQSFMSSQRMVNLIADLLNLSRLNTGKFVIDAQPTDLRVIVDQEVAQLRESAKAKGITLRWQMPPTFSMLNLDEGKIHQVVMNFIDNALYYTPEGGDIEVSLTETPRSIEYRVKDTGIGVPREIQRHLFSKFYRADNARRMRPDGTGLGIYMAKKVIAAQGGSVIFESEEGKGSTFGFRFSKTRANKPEANTIT
ncbi:hypothetical protein KA016_01115 [Candidatus Saccharibacteria bacterium]|jgi:signal transduction histidine kinase|nr:hypothetical protein [Candidatus Saccharibacteria bacterium]